MMPKKRASEFLGAESAHTIKKKGSKDESTCVSLHNHTKTYTNLRCSGKQDLAWMHIDYAKNHTRVCTSHSGIICSWIAASQSICKPLSDHPPIVGLAGHVQLTLFFFTTSAAEARADCQIRFVIWFLHCAHMCGHMQHKAKNTRSWFCQKTSFGVKGGWLHCIFLVLQNPRKSSYARSSFLARLPSPKKPSSHIMILQVGKYAH